MKNEAKQPSRSGLIRWTLILIFLIVTVIASYVETGIWAQIAPIAVVVSLFIAIWLNGTVRYGFKNMLIFFLITWVVSNFFEALSIQTGFPFGHYFYDKLIGPRIFEVPIIIMFAYFGAGYSSWILSHILLQQFHFKLMGKQIFYVPFIATFIMVMWDLCMDPLTSTLGSLWVWRDGGVYFGVPLQNYFGWFFVVYIIFQLFALYISHFDPFPQPQVNTLNKKCYWEEIIWIYGILALSQLLNPFFHSAHFAIYGSMALVTVFTMVFVVVLAYVILKRSQEIEIER